MLISVVELQDVESAQEKLQEEDRLLKALNIQIRKEMNNTLSSWFFSAIYPS